MSNRKPGHRQPLGVIDQCSGCNFTDGRCEGGGRDARAARSTWPTAASARRRGRRLPPAPPLRPALLAQPGDAAERARSRAPPLHRAGDVGASCREDLASGVGAEEHLGPQATAECGGVRGEGAGEDGSCRRHGGVSRVQGTAAWRPGGRCSA